MASATLPRLLDDERLIPLIDAMAGLGDGGWRRAFVAQIAPRLDDVIVEIGCGDGAMTLALAAAAPRAAIIAVDPDAAALARAEERAREAGVSITFLRGLGRDLAHLTASWAPTKVVASMALHAMPLHEQGLILRAAHESLRADGQIHLAEMAGPGVGVLSGRFLGGVARALRAPRAVESDTLRRLLREAGFKAVDEQRRFSAFAGTISLFSARAN